MFRLLALLLWLSILQPALAEPAMRFVYADYRPYSWVENGKVVGLEIDLLEEALGRRLGIRLEHQVLPWERAQQYVREGVADAFIASWSNARTAYAVVGREPVSFWELSLFFRKGDERFRKVRNLKELSGHRIGSLIGNAWMRENFDASQVHFVERMEQLPRMLVAGRIDVIADNPYVLHHILRSEPEAARIEEIALAGHKNDMLLYIGKRSRYAGRMGEIEEVLRKMRADGTWQRIHDRYKSP